MRKAVTNLEIAYEQVEVSPEESEQRLNEMFDILFEETLKYMKEKKALEKENAHKIENQIGKEVNQRYESL